MNLFKVKKEGLDQETIKQSLIDSINDKKVNNVLIIPPDFTRFHSNAGFITNYYYHLLTDKGINVDILPALGTHVAMKQEEIKEMYGDIPQDKFLVHNWREDVVRIGEIPGDYIASITDNLWNESVPVEISKYVMDKKYDLIISVGQVVPHEVVGMANHAKNLFVGVGGSKMINSSHMIGAIYGMEKIMGKDHSPVRKLFDYGFENFLKDHPIMFVLTVTSVNKKDIITHGLFISEDRECLNKAIELSQQINVDYTDKPFNKCVVYLDPLEYKSTWLGNKAIYRTRMAMADNGELIILAKGVDKFGEDKEIDSLIRKYGYTGRMNILEKYKDLNNTDLRNNLSAAAHLIHGSSDGRFNITYAVENISEEEIRSVGFKSASYSELVKKYNPDTLQYGFNTINGEEIYYIPNPALGLWIDKERFKK